MPKDWVGHDPTLDFEGPATPSAVVLEEPVKSYGQRQTEALERIATALEAITQRYLYGNPGV